MMTGAARNASNGLPNHADFGPALDWCRASALGDQRVPNSVHLSTTDTYPVGFSFTHDTVPRPIGIFAT